MEDRIPYWFYEFTHLACMAVFNLGFSLRTEGRRNVPATGPALLIANHQSYLDPAVVGLATRRHLCFLARETLFRRPAFARLIRLLNAVPVDQDGVGIGGLRIILRQLQSGRAVVIFPEGHRTPDGNMLPLKPGVQLLIQKAKAPVVPVGIAGTFDAWPRWSPLPIPAPVFLPAGKGSVAVSVGRALPPERFVDLS